MADGIDAGAFLEYELGIQVMPDDGTDSFEGIDLLDPTKFVPGIGVTNDMLRDGMHQTAVHTGLAPYRPNSLHGGQPLVAGTADGGYVQVARPVNGVTVRANPVSFDDHFSQAAVFYRSLTPLEQAHIVEAFTFELASASSKRSRNESSRSWPTSTPTCAPRSPRGWACPHPRAARPPTSRCHLLCRRW